MNHIAAAEEQIVSERIKQKLHEVNLAAQEHLSPIQDHVNFNLQVPFRFFNCCGDYDFDLCSSAAIPFLIWWKANE